MIETTKPPGTVIFSCHTQMFTVVLPLPGSAQCNGINIIIISKE